MSDSPFDIPLSFEALAGFTPTIRPLADGVRASTASECASCAVIEYLAPDDERVRGYFNPGVGAMGHMLHQWWAWQAFGDAAIVEAPIPWEHGISHDDVVMNDGKWAGLYEVKTHSETKAKAPSKPNTRQAEFRLRLRERAGLPIPGPMRLVMIGKAGQESGWVRGPWTVELTDERRAEIDETLAFIEDVMRRAETVDLHGSDLRARGCTTCFPRVRVYATAGLSDLIDQAGRLKAERAEAEAERKLAAAARDELDKELQPLQAHLCERLKPGAVYEAISFNASLDKRGTLRVIRRHDAPVEAVAS